MGSIFAQYGTAIQLGLTVLAGECAVVALMLIVLALALWRQVSAVRAGRYPAETGYQRYVQARFGTGFFVLFVVVMVSAALLLMPPRLIWPSEGPLFSSALACILSFSVVPLALYPLLRGIFVDMRALQTLRHTVAPTGELASLALKLVLLTYLPPLVFLETIALVVLSRRFDLLWIVALSTLVYLALTTLSSTPIYRWLIRTAPLEQTQWAALAPRVRAWAQLAGISLKDIRIEYTAARGMASSRVTGLRSPTLFLSDLFLANSEWRQQDALVAGLLGLARQRKSLFLLRQAHNVAALIAFAAIIVYTGAPSAIWYFWAFFFVWVGIPLGLAVASINPLAPLWLRRLNLYMERFETRHTRVNVDRFAAHLTGDPMAMIVAFNTLNTLNGSVIRRQSGHPSSLAQRMEELDTLMRQPGPRAPWADLPVPSTFPFTYNGRTLTVPLDQAPPPAPVPATHYPEASANSAQGDTPAP